MHPVIANKKILAAYFFIWLFLAMAFTSFIAAPGSSAWLSTMLFTVPLFIVYGMICLSAWYLCKFAAMRKAGIIKVFLIFGIAAFVNSALWFLIAVEWGRFIGEMGAGINADHPAVIQTQLFLTAGFMLYLLSGAGHYIFIMYNETQAARERLIELNMLAREAELKALRSQINPHFLFNSLNSISALTSSDPPAARRMTELLAEFFRKSLQAGKKDFVTFKEELELTSHYLDIEHIRFGKRLSVKMDIENDCLPFPVPPLILQPLIENAVKHGIAHLIDGGTISINSECAGKMLKISVENPFDPERPKGSGNRVGLENIRGRLEKIYGPKSDVVITEKNNIFKAVISIRE